MKWKGDDIMDNKIIFATNLVKYMSLYDKSRSDLANDLGFSYYTVTDWVKGKKYPRMDKIEMLADYFGILKSDLIEEDEKNKNSSAIQLTEDEEHLLNLFRSIPEDKKRIAIEMLKAALQTK
jgi:transcriptional regulator with XRE-family HTH domain